MMSEGMACSRRGVLTGMLALGAAAAAGPCLAESAAARPQCTPRLAIRGMSLPSWWNGTYTSERYTESLNDLRGLGFNAIAIIPTHFLKSVDGSEIFANEQTESIDNVARAVKLAGDRGLLALVKPHLHVKGYSQPPQAIDPADKDAFFDGYRALIRRYAELAQATGAFSLAIGAELGHLSGPEFRSPWLQVIGDARRHFRGPLIYAANWGEDQQVSFWDALDYIGIDMYAPMAIGERVTPEAILQRWTTAPSQPDAEGPYGRAAYLDLFRDLAARHGKPIMFTEIGIRSVTGALTKPWDYNKTYAVADFTVQTAFYEALMKIACEDNDGWLAGMYLWGWHVDAEPKGNTWVADFTIEDKPAAGVIKRYFGG